ncbi:hypothetical protein SO802_007919 [Lithocarpus litseifolius]|uniref:Uncharacterized protein n=1 Tax=Lithocarpus litseifolius TaxID=425828 RepID=A0AAW2DV26_9ROSI
MRVWQLVPQDCYDQTGNYVKSNTASMLHAAMYTISNTKKKFTIVGFDTLQALMGSKTENSHLFGTSILVAMLLLWNKADSISPLIFSRTFQMKLSQWCLTGQLEMRNVDK